MANTPGAKKAIRKIARRTEVNKARRSRTRSATATISRLWKNLWQFFM